MHRIKHLPSPALVVSMIALLVALGGTGYAAVEQVIAQQHHDIHVKDRSLLAKDFKSGQIPRGPRRAPPALPVPAAPPAPQVRRPRRRGEGVRPRARRRRRRRHARARDQRRGRLEAGATGVYCIDVDGGAVNVIATLDAGAARARSVSVDCCSAARRARRSRSTRTDSAGAAGDRPFYLLVN